MTTVPPPTAPDYTGLSDDEATLLLRAYNDACYDYQFQSDWLRLALSPGEYAQVCDYQVSMLVDLYPWIAEYGPQGEQWHAYLVRVEATLHAAATGDEQATNVIDSFIETYGRRKIFSAAMSTKATVAPEVQAPWLPPQPPTEWDMAYHTCDDTYRGDQLLVEFDLIPEPLVVRISEHSAWRMFVKHQYQRDQIDEALNRFSALVLAADVIAAYRSFDPARSLHEKFVAWAGW